MAERLKNLLPPGPAAPALVQTWRWIYRPVELMEECFGRYGEWFTLRFPRGLNVVFTASPEAAKDVFVGDPDKLFAGEGNIIFKPLLGRQSLLVLDGPEHRRARRLMMPPFHGERMKAYGKTIQEIASRHIARWPRGKTLPFHPAMQDITLEVILSAIFGMSEGNRLVRLREKLIELLNANQSPTDFFIAAVSLKVDGRPALAALQESLGRLTAWGRFVRLRQDIDEILFEEIAERRSSDLKAREDILSLLMMTVDQEGRALNDGELRDEMITLLVAGHETSATALSWLFYRLARNPDTLAALREQLSACSTPEDIAASAYLEAVLNESLRLNPVVPFIWRILKAPMRLGGRDLPAGVAIAPSIYLIHRSPKIWAHPEVFDPDRFKDFHPAPWEFLPFGGGGRRCLGMAFAQYEIKLIAAAILKAVDVEPSPGYEAKAVRRGVTFTPSEEMPVILKSLPAPQAALI